VPSTEDELGGLDSDQWRELHDCASRLEKTLLAGAAAVDLRRFLPPPEAPHRRAVLHELIKTELEARYNRHQGCLLEEYLRLYPELGGPDDLPAGLLYEEYRLRRKCGDHPALDEYRARFPVLFEQFRRRLRMHPPPEPSASAAYQTIRPATTPDSDSPAQESLSGTTSPLASPVPSPSDSPTPTFPQAAGGQRGTSSSQLLPGGEGYELLERIGKGQFGEVYRARAPGGVVVAVKRMYRALDDESSQRELKALHKIRELRHPFLLQTHNFQAFEDRLIIVMELADGSLQDRLKECSTAGLPGVPVQELLQYFTEAAEALDFLHQEKLSHRDIKPQNLLRLKGHAKVADFGIARAQEKAVDHTMNTGGTPAYMPPEMWRGDISVHSDQYGFALTWYEMRCGRRAFSGRNYPELYQQHLTKQPELSGVPEEEQKVLLRALAKEPNQRFPSCVAFVQALKEANAPPKPALPSQGRGVKVMLALLALALAAGLVGLGVERWGPQPQKVVPGTPWKQVDWLPIGWEAEVPEKIVKDINGRRYYKRLVRDVGGQKVVMVVVPKTERSDPKSFYIMENKVWNDLYAAYMKDPQSKRLLQKYSVGNGREKLVSPAPLGFEVVGATLCGLAVPLAEPGPVSLLPALLPAQPLPLWRRGGYAPDFNPDPDKWPFFGVDGPNGRLPVFRITVTEAHCFAEWLDGRLPTKMQWLQAAGKGKDTRPGPFEGEAEDKQGLAIGLLDGPRRVDWGTRDVSIHGCRQMAGNGFEWTRDLAQHDKGEIPLTEMLLPPHVVRVGQSYLAAEPLTFNNMDVGNTWNCTEVDFDITFRVVLEE
jgi:serine/threonine protein kinase